MLSDAPASPNQCRQILIPAYHPVSPRIAVLPGQRCPFTGQCIVPCDRPLPTIDTHPVPTYAGREDNRGLYESHYLSRQIAKFSSANCVQRRRLREHQRGDEDQFGLPTGFCAIIFLTLSRKRSASACVRRLMSAMGGKRTSYVAQHIGLYLAVGLQDKKGGHHRTSTSDHHGYGCDAVG